jgi:hypothetical protein
MPSRKHSTSDAPQVDPVQAWRFERLRAAGLSRSLAGSVSADRAYDLHALLELIDRGCPPELAIRILAPLHPPALDPADPC